MHRENKVSNADAIFLSCLGGGVLMVDGLKACFWQNEVNNGLG